MCRTLLRCQRQNLVIADPDGASLAPAMHIAHAVIVDAGVPLLAVILEFASIRICGEQIHVSRVGRCVFVTQPGDTGSICVPDG